jgi:hypothetical protein
MSSPIIRVLNVDDAFAGQDLTDYDAESISLRHWGPTLRLACRFRTFARFEQELKQRLRSTRQPAITFIGSGDFHHVTLALLARLRTPCNLLVLDNHPDWMCGVPFLHCGTWLNHAARLRQVRRIFHVGGDVDFENRYRWLAPWSLLRSGKIVVLPAQRRFRCGTWTHVPTEPIRKNGSLSVARLLSVLHPYRSELGRRPLYVSVDKDVLHSAEATVNWDSGHLTLDDLTVILEIFLQAARGRLAGFDTVGDWSRVAVRGPWRRLLHRVEHPVINTNPDEAICRNQAVNRRLLEIVGSMSDLPEKSTSYHDVAADAVL